MGTEIATIEQLEGALNNSFMLGILSDTHNMPENELIDKINELLKYLKS